MVGIHQDAATLTGIPGPSPKSDMAQSHVWLSFCPGWGWGWGSEDEPWQWMGGNEFRSLAEVKRMLAWSCMPTGSLMSHLIGM